jgi:undecaprenyl-diphosphatase
MNWWEGLILGLVQGLTEFLPVSSSGHLVIGKELLGLSKELGGTTFEVFVHFGTVMSICVVYHESLRKVILEGTAGILSPRSWKSSWAEKEGFRLAVLILISMIPTGLVYVLAKDFIEAQFQSARFASGMLMVTSVLLFMTLLGTRSAGQLAPWKAFLIGLAQSFAMLPGISRSGSTIAMALYLGTQRAEAARFSFLMSVPVIVGATLLDVIDIIREDTVIYWIPLLLGMAAAFVSGVFAIRTVMAFVQKGRLHWFAIYCLIVGICGVLVFSNKSGVNLDGGNEPAPGIKKNEGPEAEARMIINETRVHLL